MRPLLALLAVAALLGGCARAELAEGDTRVELGPGAAAAVAEQGGWQPVADGARVASGRRVRADAGRVVLALGGGHLMELRVGAEVVAGKRPELRRGAALVTSGVRPLVVRADRTVIEVGGAARVQRSHGVDTAVYGGAVAVRTAGRQVSVPAFRQLSVPALGLPGAVVPLVWDAADPWDRRLLGPAMEASRLLQATSNGLTAQLAPRPSWLELLPAPAGGIPGAAAAGQRPPGEVFVGLAVAEAGGTAPLAERLSAALAFRDEGAPWGLVVLDRAAAADDVFSWLERAVEQVAAALVPRAPEAPVGEVGGPVAAPPPSTTGSDSRSETPAPGGSSGAGGGSGTGSGGAGGLPAPGDVGEVDDLGDVVGGGDQPGLLGGLLDLVEEPAPEPDDGTAESGTNGLIGGLLGQ